MHRGTEGAAIYFLANTSNEPKHFTADLRYEAMYAEQMDPLTGKIEPAPIIAHPEGYTSLDVDLAPYGSTIFMLTNRMASEPPATRPAATPTTVDLSTGWTVSFGADGKSAAMTKLHSWADDDATRSFSGVATYSNEFNVVGETAAAFHATIDFGRPTATGSESNRTPGFSANLDAPIRDAAVVYINDKLAGSIWCAPYRLNVTGLLHAGKNEIRVEVANTAVNYFSSHDFPNYDYTGVTATFGKRFAAPAASSFLALPSGLLGPITLVMTP